MVEHLLQKVFNEVLLHHAEGDDADALRVGIGCQAAFHFLDDGLGLGSVRTAASLVIDTLNGHELHLRLLVVNGREGDEFAVIVFVVGEGDERLVARTVVPVELQRRDFQRATVLQNALQVIDVGFILVHVGRGKETRWGHLFGITHHDKCLTAGNGSNGFAGRHLGGLVKNDQVELLLREI